MRCHRIACIAPALLASALALPAVEATEGEWSRFRGPNGTGVSPVTGLPTEMSPAKNVTWAAEVPFGRSSPAVGTDRVFLTAVEDGKLITLALDRASGKTLWRRELDPAAKAELHASTDSATPTPVTDGVNVYAFFHEAGLVSYDRDGKERWRVALGPFRNFYGIASSPVLAGDMVLVLCDQAEGAFLLAVDRHTGTVRWRRNRPARLESYTTPVLYPDAAKPHAVMVSGSRWIDVYDLATGESLWTLAGVGSGPISSPVLAGDTFFVNAHDHVGDGWPPFEPLAEEHDADLDGELTPGEVEGAWVQNHFGWLDADGSGKISAADWKHIMNEISNDNWGVFAVRVPGAGTGAKILWNYKQNVPYIPSPLVYDGVFYMVKDGIMTALDPETGELLKRGRLGSGSPKVYASPVAADGKLYLCTLEGQLAVVAAGAEWRVLATNELGDEIWATPAIADSSLFVRTRSKLYRFALAAASGEPPGAASQPATPAATTQEETP